MVPLERTQDGPTRGHDQERVERVDGALIERSYRVLHDDLVRFCAGRGADRGRAEDIAQETFARATEHAWATGDVPRWPWLMVTARRLLRDLDQRRGANPTAPDELYLEDPTADPAGLTITSEDHRWLRDRLAELPAGQRDALVLEDRGWSTREVALLLGISEGCVRQLRHRGRAALQVAWADREALGGFAVLPVVGQRVWDRLRAAAARARDRVLQLDTSSLAATSDVAGAAVAVALAGMALGGPAAALTATMPPAAPPSVVHLAGVVPTSESGPVPPSEASTVLGAAVRGGPAVPGAPSSAADDPAAAMGPGPGPDIDVVVTPADEVPAASGASITVTGETEDGTRRIEDAHEVPLPVGDRADGHGEVTLRCEGTTGSTACTGYDAVADAGDGDEAAGLGTDPARTA